MKKQAQRLGFQFPYLYDETQEVAREYHAACTPDLFLFDADMKLVYRGQLDDSRPQRPSGGGNDIPVTGKDLRAAMDAVLAGKRPTPTSASASAATSSGKNRNSGSGNENKPSSCTRTDSVNLEHSTLRPSGR